MLKHAVLSLGLGLAWALPNNLLPLTVPKASETGCQLEPVQGDLNDKSFEIYTYKYTGDGVHATDYFSSVRHEGCSGGGACVWKFIQCDYSADYEGGIYVLQNKKYQTYLYGNIAYAMSHVTDTFDNVCYVYKNYHHIVFRDPCSENQYYLYNLGYSQWVYGSAAGLMTHSDCNTDASLAHGCGDFRTLELRDLTIPEETMNGIL